MNRDDDHLPIRQATRIVNIFQFGAPSFFTALADGDLARAAVLLMVLRSALRGEERPVGVNAIATSLARPSETIRRHVHALLAKGFCSRDAGGLIVPRLLGRSDIAVAGDRLLDSFDVMIDGLERCGIFAPAAVRHAPRSLRLAAALDVYLAVFELSERRYGSWVQLQVLGAITVGNASRLAHDPILGLRYGYTHTPPPREYRVPMSIRAIASLADLPYATAWRHVKALLPTGILEETTDGYLLQADFLFSDAVIRQSIVKIRYVRRVLADLAARCG